MFTIERDTLSLASFTDVRVEHKERPERLDFATPSRLVVVTEGPATLIEFRVTRRGRGR